MDWDKHIQSIRNNISLSVETKSLLIDSLSFLKNELGVGFMKSTELDNPIILKIINSEKYPMSLIRFANTLKTMMDRDAQSYLKIRQKLFSSTKCRNEAIPFLDIASSLIDNGLTIGFIEEERKQRTPDIRVENSENQDIYFIEFTQVGESSLRRNLNNKFRKISKCLVSCHLPYSGRMLRDCENYEVLLVCNSISHLVKQATQEGRVINYKDDRFELVIGQLDELEDLHNWCNSNNQSIGQFNGFSIEGDETFRIINNKIKSKVRQLPFENGGFIYLRVHPTHFMASDLYQSISAIEKEVNKYKHLMGIVIYSEIIGNVAPGINFIGRHIYCRRMVDHLVSKDLLFVFNEAGENRLKTETWVKILKSFVG